MLCSASPRLTREVLLQVVGGLLWPCSGQFHGTVDEVSMVCSKHGLRVVWLKCMPLWIVWIVLK